jgi:hypothetical protein
MKMNFRRFSKKIVYIIVPPVLLLFLYIFLLLPGEFLPYAYVVLSFYYVAVLFSFLKRKIWRDDDMKTAWKFLCDWWYNFRMEDLSTLNGKGFTRYFGKDKYIAFVIDRGEIGQKAYQTLVCVVKTNPLEIVDWDDNPRDEKIKNPFIDISPIFVGSPSLSIRPELEPSLLRPKIFKKEIEREEEQTEEGEQA